MTYQSSLTATPTIPKPRAFAMGFVVLLHIALVTAIGNGLKTPSLPFVPGPLVTTIIELTKTSPHEVELVVPTTPQKVIDNTVFIPPTIETSDSGSGITETRPPVERHPEVAKVVTPPRIDAKHPLTQPAYPSASKRAGETGTVELMLYVMANGRIGEARVERSSGFAKLDDAAIKEALRAWRLQPQQVDGVAVAAWHKIAVTFRLQD